MFRVLELSFVGAALAILGFAIAGPASFAGTAAEVSAASSSTAQTTSPSNSKVASTRAAAVITPKGEPGEPLEVSGVIYEADGRTPVAGVRVFIYHTDAKGYYSQGGQDRQHAKFHGTMTTGADGLYRFRTIRPGHYPGGNTAQHIHYELETKTGQRQTAEMLFADDPVLSKAERSRADDPWSDVRPVRRDASGKWIAVFDIRLRDRTP